MNDSVLLDSDVASFLFKKSPFAEPFRPLIRGKPWPWRLLPWPNYTGGR